MTVALSSSAALLSAMASGAAMAGSDAAASDVGAVAEEAIGSCSPASSPSCVEGSNASSYSCAPMRSAEELVRLDARWHAVEQRSAKSWLAEHLFGGERSLFERRCSVERMRIYAPPNRHSLDEIFGEGATAFIERFGAKLYVELCERDIATMRYAICPHFEELDRLYGFPDHIHEALEELGTYDYNEYVAIPWHALKTREEVGQYAAIARGHSYGTIGVILNLVPLISCLKDFRRAIDDARHIVNVFHDYRFKAFEESSPISLDLLKTHACLGNGRLEALVERMGLAALDSALEVYEDKKRSIMRQLLASFPPDRTDLLEDASRYLDEFKGYGPLFFSTVLPTVAGIAESPEELKRVCESGLQVADAIHGERCDKLPRA